MPEKEPINKNECNKEEPLIFEKIHALPKRYFELMNLGSQLAKQGEFEKATTQFAEARKEAGHIIQQLLEMPKGPIAQMWQFFGILWAFKLIKSVFYWFLAKSETAKTPKDRKEILMAAVGTQQLGADLIPAFENLNQSFRGEDRDLLPMLGEAIRNFEERQRILAKALEEQGLEFQF
ncbi:MAG: hypothetical protein ACFFCH_10620 [Promethearchaeota archaeon]